MESNKALVVNFFGAPGARKSTMAYGLAYALRCKGIVAEVSWEVAKEYVYAGEPLPNQLVLANMQAGRLRDLARAVDVVITDSPLPMGLLYSDTERWELKDICLGEFKAYNNLNYFLYVMQKTYTQTGRLHDLNQAMDLQAKLASLLEEKGISYEPLSSTDEGISIVVDDVVEKLKDLGRLPRRDVRFRSRYY